MKHKRIISFTVTAGMLISIIVPQAFAVDNSSHTKENINMASVIYVSEQTWDQSDKIAVGNAEYIDDGSGILIPISQLPSFDTQEEADKYMDSLVSSVVVEEEYIDNTVSVAATSLDKTVAQKGISGATLRLKVSYSKNSQGQVTSRKPYTTFTGFTLGLSWHQKRISSSLSSNKKKISASTSGEIAMYILIDGMLEVGRRTHSLSGTISA